jgi:hypothetical protein
MVGYASRTIWELGLQQMVRDAYPTELPFSCLIAGQTLEIFKQR